VQSCKSVLLRTYIPEKYNSLALSSALLRVQPPLAIITKRGRKRRALAFRALLLELALFLDPVGAPKLLGRGVTNRQLGADEPAAHLILARLLCCFDGLAP
jgi:hypothetical protein